MTNERNNHFEVYRCPEWKLWAYLKFDAERNVLNEADWYHYKSQAVNAAVNDMQNDSDDVREVRVFTANNDLQKVIRRTK